jgi:hypothetical protein
MRRLIRIALILYIVQAGAGVVAGVLFALHITGVIP